MFNINLVNTIEFNKIQKCDEEKSYDTELDDETSIIFDICNFFEETGEIKFIVSGFGDSEWGVDCKFDLPGIIEILPELISKLNQKKYDFNLNFYEQGVEREVIFRESKGSIIVSCLSQTKWKLLPSNYEMTKESVEKIVRGLYNTFILYSEKLCPRLIKNPLLLDWMKVDLENSKLER